MNKLEPYGLVAEVERLVLFYCASNTRFWSRMGKELEFEMLHLAEAKPILTICHAVTKETGAGPTSPLIVIQRLQHLVGDGKFTVQGVSDVYDLFEAAEDGDKLTIEAVIDLLKPGVQHNLHAKAIEASIHDFGHKGNMSVTRGLLDKAQRIGQSDELAGTTLNSTSAFSAIEAGKNVTRLPTGIVELDMGIDGGLVRKCVGVGVGHSGSGKSMMLATGAGEAVRNRIFTGFISLELGEDRQAARLIANLTGIPSNDIYELDPARKEAQRRMELLEGHIGRCEIAEFSPKTTTVPHLIEWIDQKEQDAGMQMEAFFVDYADKMGHPGLRNSGEYEVMGYVYEGLRRDIAVARDMWVWTMSQSTRSKESQKRIELHHVADSIQKVRVADLVVTINRDEDSNMINLWVAKNRHGRQEFTVGPLMTHFECGRFVPVASEIFDWNAV